jgi:hypothetical protein
MHNALICTAVLMLICGSHSAAVARAQHRTPVAQHQAHEWRQDGAPFTNPKPAPPPAAARWTTEP